MPRIMLTLLVALLFPVTARGEATAISLREAVDLALERHHLLRSAVAERQAATAQLAASRSRYLPNLFLDLSAAASNSPTQVFMMKLNQGRFTQTDFQVDQLNNPSSSGDFRTALGIVQPLYDTSVSRGMAVAERELDERDVLVAGRRQELVLQVYRACVEVQRSNAQKDVAEQAVAAAREHLRLARVRTDAGMGLKSDELRASTFLAEMEEQRITADNDRQLARLRLGQAVAAPPGTFYELTGRIEPLPVRLSLEDARQRSLQERPELRAAQAAVARGEAEVRLAQGSYLPTVYGNALYEMHDRDYPLGRDNDAWQVGVTLRWELVTGGGRGAAVERARALQIAEAERLEGLRAEVALQVDEAWLRHGEAQKRLEVVRAAVSDAEEAVRLVTKRFENSLATVVELLDAQTALNRARFQVVDSEGRLALATARLHWATGMLLEEVRQ